MVEQTVMDDFEALFPCRSNAELARQFGVSERTIARWARSRGLRKSALYVSAVSRAARAKANPNLPRGAAHWKWKGGRAWERFKDPRYVAWRNAVLQRDGYRCQSCFRQCKRHELGLAAHHIVAWADDEALRYEVENGVTLCRSCHMELHGLGTRPIPLVLCACGCGTPIPCRDAYGRPRRYVNRHGKRGKPMPLESRDRLSLQRRGRALTAEHRRNISAGLRASAKRVGRPPKTT